jgi:AcrR family transcriptional regulator
MAVVSPHGLARQLNRLLPRVLPTHGRSRPGATDRILDAALSRFAESGVGGTTMAQLARDSGISREWLYRHFRSRDEVAIAVARREVERLINGLGENVDEKADLVTNVAEAFSFAVEFVRDHELLQQVIRNEPQRFIALLHDDGGVVLATAVDVSVVYLRAISSLTNKQTVVVAETLVRLVVALTVAPNGRLDLGDPAELRRFARAVAAPLLAGAN